MERRIARAVFIRSQRQESALIHRRDTGERRGSGSRKVALSPPVYSRFDLTDRKRPKDHSQFASIPGHTKYFVRFDRDFDGILADQIGRQREFERELRGGGGEGSRGGAGARRLKGRRAGRGGGAPPGGVSGGVNFPPRGGGARGFFCGGFWAPGESLF